MNFDDSLRNEMSLLLLLAMEGKITPEGFGRLQQLLKTIPQARRTYFTMIDTYLGLEEMEVQSELHGEGLPFSFNPAVLEALAEYERIAPIQPAPVAKPAPVVPVHPSRQDLVRPPNKVALAAALASLAAVLLLIALVYVMPPRAAGVVGRLSRATGAKWATVHGAIELGSDLSPGPMHLLEGAAEITLNSGATLILEAPALVELETSSRIFLNRGRLVATVENNPEDRFVVRTPFSTVVDFGTEFGVQVESNTMRTHVFRGQVELRSGTDPLKYQNAVMLNSEQGGGADSDGKVARLEVAPQTFLRSEQYTTLERAARGDPFYRWKAYTDRMHRDPAMVAHYTFEQEAGRRDLLVNRAPQTIGAMDGMPGIEGSRPQWVKGRWPRKQALRFDRETNQRIVVPAHEGLSITGPLTVAAWIYLEPGDQSGHLLSCRDHLNVHYQFGWLGDSHPDKPRRNRIQLLRYTENRTQRGYSSVVSLQSGTWHCIAATHDNRVARFYLNGVLISEVPDPFTADPTAADLVIGDVPFEDVTNWRFDGTVDEIVIMNRVMRPAELATLYQAGKP